MARRRDDLLIGPKEKAIEAIKAGKQEEAIKYIEELDKEGMPLHNRLVDYINILYGYVAEKLGEEAIDDVSRRIANEIYADTWRYAAEHLTPEEMVRIVCTGFRGHHAGFYVEEDEEKYVIHIASCSSGGRIQKEGKAAGRMTKKAYPWSYGQTEVPYYCCHESVFNNVLEKMGIGLLRTEYFRQFDNEGKPISGACPCQYIVYKNKTKK